MTLFLSFLVTPDMRKVEAEAEASSRVFQFMGIGGEGERGGWCRLECMGERAPGKNWDQATRL